MKLRHVNRVSTFGQDSSGNQKYDLRGEGKTFQYEALPDANAP